MSAEVGLGQTLRDLGIPRDAIPAMADGALTVTRILKNNPRPVTKEDAVAIYEEAY